MTISPKVKAELQSALVTFITVFIGVASPLLLQHINAQTVIDGALITAIISAAGRSAVKAVYQLLVNDYTTNDQPAI
jgi:hypothetical protein